MLTQEQIRFYHENGYLGVEGVFSAQEIAELRRVTEEFVEKSREATESNDFFDLEPGHSPEAPRLRRLKQPHVQHTVYDQARCHDRMLDVVAQLIGPAIRARTDKLNMKSAEYGSPVGWHQDAAFWPHTNEDVCTVGIALDDMKLENGGLLVIPGAHRGPVYNHHQDGYFVGTIVDPRFNPKDAVPVEVKAGGISIHHIRMPHGSAPNTSGQSRRLYLCELRAVDAWPLGGIDGDWNKYNDMILRGEPTNRPRLEAHPVLISLPPAPLRPGHHGGSIYEVQNNVDRDTLVGLLR